MKLIIITILFGLLGCTTSKPLESNDATDALVEIEKQRLIKFPEELEQPGDTETTDKNDEAKRILQEIEKINQALGYVKKQSEQRMPAILDSSQYLFPNAGYQPFHSQYPHVTGTNGEALLLPSIRSVKLEESYHKASEYNVPPTKNVHKQKISKPKNPLYFQPHRVEVAAPQNSQEKQPLPTHFVIPVRLYKHNKQQYLDKHNPLEYQVKGYKIVGDIDHFSGKTKHNKTSGNKIKSSPKYHLFFVPQEVVARTSQTDIKASSAENTSREEKLAHRPYKVQSNAQAITSGNSLNATSSSQIIKKRLVPKHHKGSNTNSIIAASASTVVKVTPSPSYSGQNQEQQYQKPLVTQNQIQSPQQQQQQFQKPQQQITQIIQSAEPTTSFVALSNPPTQSSNSNNVNKKPNRPLFNFKNNNNDNNNNIIRNRPLLELQNNINNINNATSNAIKTAFQNIFRLPFGQDAKPQSTTEYSIIETVPLQMPQYQQQQQQQQQPQPQQQNLHPSLAASNMQQSFFTSENLQNDHLDSDYKWDDENVSTDSSGSEDHESYNSNESREPVEKKIFGHHAHHKTETQKEALKQGGIIIQKLKVRKGGIAIAGPGGVATAGSGGTAIVGPGGYALTHPRSLTIAGPGAKIIAIPANVDLKDALQRTNLATQMLPREGRIVATGPTVYYAPPTGDYVEI